MSDTQEVIIATSAEMNAALGWLYDMKETEAAKPEAERNMHLWRMAHAAVTLMLPMVAADQHMIWFRGRWRVPSSKSGWYMASEEQCVCEAGQKSHMECKHMLIAEAMNAAHWPSNPETTAEVVTELEDRAYPTADDDCPF